MDERRQSRARSHWFAEFSCKGLGRIQGEFADQEDNPAATPEAPVKTKFRGSVF